MHHAFWGVWWILIPLAAIFAGVVKRWLALQEARLDRVSRDTADESARQTVQVELVIFRKRRERDREQPAQRLPTTGRRKSGAGDRQRRRADHA